MNIQNNQDIYRTCAICRKKILRNNLCRVRLHDNKITIDNHKGYGRSVYFEKNELSKFKLDGFIKLLQSKLKSTLSEENKKIIEQNFGGLLNEKK